MLLRQINVLHFDIVKSLGETIFWGNFWSSDYLSLLYGWLSCCGSSCNFLFMQYVIFIRIPLMARFTRCKIMW